MNNPRFRRVVLALLAVIGITAGGTYVAIDTTGPSPQGNHVLTVHALTWWPQCSLPPSHPNGYVDNLRADIAAGKPTAGYFLVAPPRSFGLPDTPDGRRQAGIRSAQLAREGIPDDVWSSDLFVFAALDVEVPTVCSPTYDLPIETVNAAVEAMREMKCLANVADPCTQVLYTSFGEWTGRVIPANSPHPADTLLWLAHWNGDPSFESFNRYPFGGWTVDDIVLKQYQGDTLYNGTSVDLDSIEVDPAIFAVTPTPTSTAVRPEPVEGCGPAFYTREQALWAVIALGWVNGLVNFGGPSPALHPFDHAVVEHLLCETSTQ